MERFLSKPTFLESENKIDKLPLLDGTTKHTSASHLSHPQDQPGPRHSNPEGLKALIPLPD